MRLIELTDLLTGSMGGSTRRCPPCGCVLTVFTLHPPASATQPLSLILPPSVPPSHPPVSQSVSQERTSFSELPSLVATFLELRAAPRRA